MRGNAIMRGNAVAMPSQRRRRAAALQLKSPRPQGYKGAGRRSGQVRLKWSGRWDSNPRLFAWEANTLPLSYARTGAASIKHRQRPPTAVSLPQAGADGNPYPRHSGESHKPAPTATPILVIPAQAGIHRRRQPLSSSFRRKPESTAAGNPYPRHSGESRNPPPPDGPALI